ncbi:hypothetical protein F5883DRAFT_578392 [Diaporthe sp. PMI_573]|nr:hypothetical protein F5883DRAFT_578392 [Diaporthaceae sp. PMI_573]
MGAFPGISHPPLLAICCFEALVFAKACLSLPADDSSATSFVSSSRHASSYLKANTRGMADAEDCPFCRFCRPVTWRSPRLYRSRQGSECSSTRLNSSHWARGGRSSSHMASARRPPARELPHPAKNRWPIPKSNRRGGGVGGAEATFPSLHLTSVCALC